MEEGAKPLQNPKPTPSPPPPGEPQRDFLLHLEAYLAKRDGIDKLLKISRYAAKIALASSIHSRLPETLPPRLKAFESSVGLSRKAFRLGKFVQDVNALRSAARSASPTDRLLSAVSYGGEGLYYFVEQFVWLSKTGLISSDHSRRLQKISAWAELVGYIGSITLKVRDLRKIKSSLQSRIRFPISTNGDMGEEEIRRLREKLMLKHLSIVQDLADGLMALGDVRDGKGFLSDPLVMASAGLLSALISTQKNWYSC